MTNTCASCVSMKIGHGIEALLSWTHAILPALCCATEDLRVGLKLKLDVAAF